MFVQLRQGVYAQFDLADFSLVKDYKWCLWQRQRVDGSYIRYAMARKGSKFVYMHKLLTDYKETDHMDGNGLNNSRHNLREVSRSQNLANRAKTAGRSKYKGVVRLGRGWQAQIMVGGDHKYLGYFSNEESAARAYNAAALQHFGEFARVNPI